MSQSLDDLWNQETNFANKRIVDLWNSNRPAALSRSPSHTNGTTPEIQTTIISEQIDPTPNTQKVLVTGESATTTTIVDQTPRKRDRPSAKDGSSSKRQKGIYP